MTPGNSPKTANASPGRKRTGAIRVTLISLCLAAGAFAIGAPSGVMTKVSAAIQQAARRTGIVAPKPGKPAPRQSQPAQVLSKGQINPDGTITPDQLLTDRPIERLMSDIMADQLARPAQEKAPRLRPELEGPDREN